MNSQALLMDSPYIGGMINLTFGEWLEEEYKSRGWSQKKFAALIGVKNTAVSNWVTGRQMPDETNCDRIAAVLDIHRNEVRGRAGRHLVTVDSPAPTQTTATDTQLLTTGHASVDDAISLIEQLKAHVAQIGGTAFMNVIGRVPADSLRWAEWENEERTVPVPREWLGARSESDFVVLEVSGDCMVGRKIHSGMLVLCRKLNGAHPKDDAIVVVRVGSDVTLKVWREDGGAARLEDGHGQTVARVRPGDDVDVIASVVMSWTHHE